VLAEVKDAVREQAAVHREQKQLAAPAPTPTAAPAPTPAPAPTESPRKAAPAPAPASSGALYTEADIAALQPGELDVSRVDYSNEAIRIHGYSIGSLKKIIEAYGEHPGVPVRGAYANRVASLNERRLAGG
jgi:hypothetical protein